MREKKNIIKKTLQSNKYNLSFRKNFKLFTKTKFFKSRKIKLFLSLYRDTIYLNKIFRKNISNLNKLRLSISIKNYFYINTITDGRDLKYENLNRDDTDVKSSITFFSKKTKYNIFSNLESFKKLFNIYSLVEQKYLINVELKDSTLDYINNLFLFFALVKEIYLFLILVTLKNLN